MHSVCESRPSHHHSYGGNSYFLWISRVLYPGYNSFAGNGSWRPSLIHKRVSSGSGLLWTCFLTSGNHRLSLRRIWKPPLHQGWFRLGTINCTLLYISEEGTCRDALYNSRCLIYRSEPSIDVLTLFTCDERLAFSCVAHFPGAAHLRCFDEDWIGYALHHEISVPSLLNWNTGDFIHLRKTPDMRVSVLLIA